MPMPFTVQLNDPGHLPQDAALVADVIAAAADWSRFFNALGSVDILVNVAATTRASGGPGTVVFAGTDGARAILEFGSAHEMRMGIDPNGAAPDIIITVDPSYLQNELWLDPDPNHPSSIPSNKTDGISVFRHEIGHGIGIAGYRDLNSGTLPSGHETVWDKFVQLHSDGTAWFVGPNARTAYGGDVPVTTLLNGQRYFHLGNGSDAVSNDLMNGVVFFRGTSYAISEMDVAIMRDLGVPIAPRVHWSASVDVGPHAAAWLPAGTGDFNHDGTRDLAWYNPTTGDTETWLLSNGHYGAGVNLGPHNTAWRPAGIGDFNQDGNSDILWYNPTTGNAEIWKVANNQWAGSVNLGSHNTAWQPAGVGDFNGDGSSDILWYNPATGNTEYWKTVNGQWAGSVSLGSHSTAWRPAGLGDFDHNGISDILWYNATTGDTEAWKVANDQWAGGINFGPHHTAWQPAAAADFTSDGTSDILWYNPTSGNAEIWKTQNGQWAGSMNVGTHPGHPQFAGAGDVNHDGINDILWRDPGSTHIEAWLLAYN